MAVCLSLALLATAGQAAAQGQEGPIRVEVEAVNVLVTIIDKDSGKFIKDLNSEDFEVYEDGERQIITNFSSQTDLPLTIGLCVDTSSSVKLKLEFEKEAALDFLYRLG